MLGMDAFIRAIDSGFRDIQSAGGKLEIPI